MSLTTPSSVQKLQTALHAKAKGSPDLRFYTLYGKMYRTVVLAFAYDCCHENRGEAGVDALRCPRRGIDTIGNVSPRYHPLRW